MELMKNDLSKALTKIEEMEAQYEESQRENQEKLRDLNERLTRKLKESEQVSVCGVCLKHLLV